MSDIISKREPTIRAVAVEKGVDPELVLALLSLEREFSNLHAHGARPKLRRAAQGLIDTAYSKLSGTEGP